MNTYTYYESTTATERYHIMAIYYICVYVNLYSCM